VSASPRSFRSSQGRAGLLIGLLILDVGASAAIVAVTLAESRVLDRLQRGQVLRDAAIEAIDRSVLFSRIGLVLFVLSVIAWLVWQYRAHANLHALRVPGLRFTPGWAVGWWLIPIANLWKPFQTMRELWKASGSLGDRQGLPTWPVIGWWWASWIVANLIGRIVFGLLRNEPETVDALIAANGWIIAGEIVTILAAVLAILIVRDVVRRQSEMPDRSMAPLEAPPPRPDVPGSPLGPAA
jgi:Domain of unknown function (DUF4328)